MARPRCFCENEVLEKAVELFWKKGFHATSMQDLVEHLGINRASLYNTYGDKKTLFLLALKHYQKENTNHLRQYFDQQPSVKSGIRGFFEMTIKNATKPGDRVGCFAVNTITELIPGDSEFSEVLKSGMTGMEGLLKEYLQQGVETKELSRDIDTAALAAYFFTLTNGLQVLAKLDPNEAKLRQMVDQGLTLLN